MLSQIHIEATGSPEPLHVPATQSNGSSTPPHIAGPTIREDYIPSNGADLSSDLEGLSFGNGFQQQHPDVTI